MKKLNLKYCFIALVGLGISANVGAADYTCSDITFTPEAFAVYEFADQACLEIVEHNGQDYVKMTARITAQTSSGTHLRFRHADGELGPSHKADFRAEFDTMVDGKTVVLSELAVRQDVNVYIPQKFWSPPAMEMAEAAAPPPPPPPPPPAPEPEPEVLPATASSLPLLVLCGSLFLVIGGALRLYREH